MMMIRPCSALVCPHTRVRPRPQDLKADFFVANCHKHFCAPRGSAFLYVSRELQAGVRPVTTSHGVGAGFVSSFIWDGNRDYSPVLACACGPPPSRATCPRCLRRPTPVGCLEPFVRDAEDICNHTGCCKRCVTGSFHSSCREANSPVPSPDSDDRYEILGEAWVEWMPRLHAGDLSGGGRDPLGPLGHRTTGAHRLWRTPRTSCSGTEFNARIIRSKGSPRTQPARVLCLRFSGAAGPVQQYGARSPPHTEAPASGASGARGAGRC